MGANKDLVIISFKMITYGNNHHSNTTIAIITVT